MIFSITSKTGLKSKIPGPPPTDVVVLDSNNFDEVVMVSTGCKYFNLFC